MSRLDLLINYELVLVQSSHARRTSELDHATQSSVQLINFLRAGNLVGCGGLGTHDGLISCDGDQSAYTPAFLRIGPHFSISALRCVRRASGVARFSATGSVPSSANRDFTLASFSATCSALTSLSITGLGVPLGAYRPCHPDTSKLGSPASFIVGTSGSDGTRVLLVTP